MADIRIDNGVIITVDPERRIIQSGSVVIEKDRILDVGKTRELKEKYSANRVIDASYKLVIPGFVNAHIHFYHHIHRALCPEILPGDLASNFYQGHFASLMGVEHEIYGGFAALLETLKSGTTCFLEAGSFHPHEVMNEIGKIGLRGWMGKRVFDQVIMGHGAMVESTEQCLSANEKFLQAYEDRLKKRSRVRPCVVLVGLGRCSDTLLVESKKMADRYKVPLHLHLAATLGEVNDTFAKTGYRPVEHLYHLGVLGPNVVLIHMLHVNDREIQMLRETGTNVTHCAPTALKLVYGLSAFGRMPEMLNAGVNVAIGTDASEVCNHYDMVRLMHITALVWKDARFDAGAMTAEKVIEMATINGAKALGMEKEIGSIEKGKKADIAILDMSRPEWIPLLNVVQNFVYSASGDSVDTVIVDGEIIMENRVVKTIDEKEVLRKAQELGEDVLNQSGVEPFGTWKIV